MRSSTRSHQRKSDASITVTTPASLPVYTIRYQCKSAGASISTVRHPTATHSVSACPWPSQGFSLSNTGPPGCSAAMSHDRVSLKLSSATAVGLAAVSPSEFRLRLSIPITIVELMAA